MEDVKYVNMSANVKIDIAAYLRDRIAEMNKSSKKENTEKVDSENK